MKKMGLFTSLIWAFAIFCSCGQCLAEAAQAREAGYYTAAETIFDEAYREQFSAGFSDIASTCEAAVGNRFYSL